MNVKYLIPSIRKDFRPFLNNYNLANVNVLQDMIDVRDVVKARESLGKDDVQFIIDDISINVRKPQFDSYLYYYVEQFS